MNQETINILKWVSGGIEGLLGIPLLGGNTKFVMGSFNYYASVSYCHCSFFIQGWN